MGTQLCEAAGAVVLTDSNRNYVLPRLVSSSPSSPFLLVLFLLRAAFFKISSAPQRTRAFATGAVCERETFVHLNQNWS